ncbi:hypothetical protein [Roseomonas chloroacetimidivorans]|jgi:hypothetical protein|uniref:hypothetical protein n=1 Tax=Roseomonas chloroacetimidivorans TaxID=1766656 RepID=UPI003C72A8CA
MKPKESGIAAALRRVEEQQARLERQEQRIAALEIAGQIHLLPEQRFLLAKMKVTHQVLNDDLQKRLNAQV